MPFDRGEGVYVDSAIMVGEVVNITMVSGPYEVRHDSDGTDRIYDEDDLRALPHKTRFIKGGFCFKVLANKWRGRRSLIVRASYVRPDGSLGRWEVIRRISLRAR